MERRLRGSLRVLAKISFALKRCPLRTSLLGPSFTLLAAVLELAACFAASRIIAAGEITERELIQDNHFRDGFILWEPKPGKHVRYGELAGSNPVIKPVWGLSQWSSRFPIDPVTKAANPSGFLVLSNAAKAICLRGSAEGNGADLSLAVNTETEYGVKSRGAEEPWVHLLVEQEFNSPPRLKELAAARFHLEARLLRSRNLHHNDYSPAIHAAQFQVFFTIQNRTRHSRGYGDLVWFGIPVYDNRHPHPPEFKSKDFGGTEKFIFTPEAKTFTSRSAHDGDWIVIEKDLLPLMHDALHSAWNNGFLSASKDISDYAIGGMNMGWELPGTFDVEVEVRNLSLKVRDAVAAETKAAPAN